VEVDRVRRVERGALARGELSAADLSRAASWEVRVTQEGHELASGLSEALADEARARNTERRAQEEVELRKTGTELVVNHRARWREGLRKRLEANEEEACGEAWRPRASKKKS
jgi:hypothetical protein